tara:strand:+ start:1020 stop:1916 length:897 start_codon:yes stop_codon:yes gene_type:complete
MNRILKRPMFRIGGSAGTGITSGLDQPRKQYNQGTNPYAMGNFQPSGLPGFLTSFGLNLLATPPQGNIFQTSAIAAQDPFRTLQAQQAASMKTASDRAFAKELAKEEREFDEKQLEKKLAAEREIAGMKTTDTTERIRAIADTKYDGDEIKAAREVNFPTEIYPNLISEYGEETVATSVIDSSGLQKPKDINRFVKQNPILTRQVVYDVRTGMAMRFVKNTVTNKFELVPADSADINLEGSKENNVNKIVESEADKKKRLEKSYGFYLPDVLDKIKENENQGFDVIGDKDFDEQFYNQ